LPRLDFGTKIVSSELNIMNAPNSRLVGTFLSLFIALLMAGCASSQSGTDPDLKQIDMDVSWPMTRYRNIVSGGAVTRGEQDQVNAAYAKYQAAYGAALKAANGNVHASSPDNVKAAANEVIRILSSIPY
jgi:multidrug resistance efflux pump